MTTTDYSRKLCEICGSKPRYGVYENFGDLDNNFQLVTNERKYRLIADTRHHYGVEDEDLRNLEPKYYPNFEAPENFVRLFELKADGGTLAKNITISNAIGSRKGFIKAIVDFLFADESLAVPDIKQAIREQEWSYE